MTNPIRAIWSHAGQLADATPESRNRTVDFLRAVSIAVVIFGHWLVAAPYLAPGSGEIVPGYMIELAPWTQWLTLFVQVMPIFFLVGGYANAVAWEAAQRKQTPYGEWLGVRIQRLISPVLPVLVTWIGISVVAVALDASPELVGKLTQVALVPTWFLAVYVAVGVVVPLTHAAWRRFGLASVVGLGVAAAVIDAASIGGDLPGLGYVNYAFVWLTIHQLGYAWRDGRITRPLALSAAGVAALYVAIAHGPYPLSMVAVPGAAISNTTPPTLALLFLGLVQVGLVLVFEPALARLLAKKQRWQATVMVNGMIMSLYLWHMTAMLGVVAAAALLGGVGLSPIPDTAAWWATRPLWMAVYGLALAPILALFVRFERPRTPTRVSSRRRLVAGATLTCAGLGLASAQGLVTGAGSLRAIPSLLPLVGTAIAGFGPLPRILARIKC